MLPQSLKPSLRQSRFARVLGFWALAASIVNVTIAGTIFVFPTILYAAMGPRRPSRSCSGRCCSHPSYCPSRLPAAESRRPAGPYRYVDAAFGRFPAFLVGAIFWISNVAGSAGIAAVLTEQLARPFPMLAEPIPRCTCLFAVYAALATLNVRGIRMELLPPWGSPHSK